MLDWINGVNAEYGVHFGIFATLYAAKTVVYYLCVVRMVVCIRRRAWDQIPFWFMILLTSNLAPWGYIYLFGHHLPHWVHWMVAWILCYSFCFITWDISRRIKARGLAEQEA